MDNITLNPELQEKLISGIEKVSKVIRQSYGPKGGNVSVEVDMYPGHMIANDMQSIVQKIWLDDPLERRAVKFIQELSDKQSNNAGEGRKTTLIIAETLLKLGFKEKIEGMKLKENLDALLPQVLESIDKQSQPVEVKDIQKVAETSSRSKEIGKLIQEVYDKVGKEGIIYSEGSGTFDTSYEISEGVVFQGTTWWHPSMAHDETAQKEGRKEEKAIYTKPSILFTRTKIRNEHEISDFMDAISKSKQKDLIIFTDDIDLNVLSKMAGIHRAKVMNILVLKPSPLWQDQVYEDFARCVGADILEEGSGVTFQNIVKSINDGSFKLGTCEKLVTDSDGTVLTGIQDISAYKKELESKGDNESKRRLWRLNAKTALLKIGAGSESELSYKLLKTNDALNACRSALMDGIVEGGAKSLLKASQDLTFIGTDSVNELPTVNAKTIFSQALSDPYKQLLANENGTYNLNGEIVPLIGKELNTEGVYDATFIIKSAVKNALSLASIILTTKADIRLRDKTLQDYQIEVMQQQRFNFN